MTKSESRRRTELEVEPVSGQVELLRVSLRDDLIDVVVAKPLFENDPAESLWATLLSAIFHHVVDASVEMSGLERLRVSAALRAALVSIERRPNVGSVRACARGETLPPPIDAFELVRARLMPSGHIEMCIHGLGWSERESRQWAQLLYDLVHAGARLESLAPELLKSHVLAQIDRPSANFRGRRSRISNVLPRGDSGRWVSIPRTRAGLPEVCRLDLSLLPRAPIEGLSLALQLALNFEPTGIGMQPSDEEAEQLDERVRTAVEGLPSRQVVLASRTTRDAELSLLFYVSDEGTGARVAKRLGGKLLERLADPSWSRFLAMRPDREELRRLANSDWLDALADAGHATTGPATVRHAFWVVGADAHAQLVERLAQRGFLLTSTDENSLAGRTELIFERRLEALASSIDALTIELDEQALKVGATYDGWDVALS